MFPACVLLLLLAGCAERPVVQSYLLADPIETASWTFAGAEGQALTTPHYRLYTTSRNRRLTQTLCGFMEAARAHYADLTGLQGPALEGQTRWPIYLMASRRDWALLTERVTGSAAQMYLQIDSGGYCHQGVCVFWDLQPQATYSVAAHEGMHQFLHYTTRQALPAWAEEGLATQAEGFRLTDEAVRFDPARNVSRYNTLRRTVYSGRLRSAMDLMTTDAGENMQVAGRLAPEYYSQLWALLLMIGSDEQYAAGLRRMVADAAAGRLGMELGYTPDDWNALSRDPRAYNQTVSRQAFAHYIDPNADRFEQRYRAYARQLVGLKGDS